MVSYMSFFNDIPDGGNLCFDVRENIKSMLLEEIVSGIRYGIAKLHDEKTTCMFGFFIEGRKKEDIKRLCRKEIVDIQTELLSKHYLLKILDKGNYTREWKKYSVMLGYKSPMNMNDSDTVVVVEAQENDNIVSVDGINLPENGNIRL